MDGNLSFHRSLLMLDRAWISDARVTARRIAEAVDVVHCPVLTHAWHVLPRMCENGAVVCLQAMRSEHVCPGLISGAVDFALYPIDPKRREGVFRSCILRLRTIPRIV